MPSLVSQMSNSHLLPMQLPPPNLLHTRLISSPQLIHSTPTISSALVLPPSQLFEFSHPSSSLAITNGLMTVPTTRTDGSHNGSEYRGCEPNVGRIVASNLASKSSPILINQPGVNGNLTQHQEFGSYRSVGESGLEKNSLPNLECSVCSEMFSGTNDKQPRVLGCGHTFCSKCLSQLVAHNTIECPACRKITALPNNLLSGLPINYALVDASDNLPVQTLLICQSCSQREAIMFCSLCGPNDFLPGFKLCEECSVDEHDRPSAIARTHNPILISEMSSNSPSDITCSIHGFKADFYDPNTNLFLCQHCTKPTEDTLLTIKPESLSDAVKRRRAKLHFLLQRLGIYTTRVQRARHEMQNILADLRPSADAALKTIRDDIAKYESALQRRRAVLMNSVEQEYGIRLERLQNQQQQLAIAASSIASFNDMANILLQKKPSEFLPNSDSVIKGIEQVLSEENSIHLRTLVQPGIPVMMDEAFLKQLDDLGAVGGGPVPTNIKCVHKKGLFYLEWDPPDCKVTRYEIEREFVPSVNRGSVEVLLAELQTCSFYMDASRGGQARIDGLCPGASYKFRARSENAAGWGVWSEYIDGSFHDFPLEIGYTGDIVDISIPIDGSYAMQTKGAKAADGLMSKGGCGADITAIFYLSAGDRLEILCGGMSQRHASSSGGGGGTFVSVNGRNNPLIVAGGGGGTRGYDEDDPDGQDGSLEEWGRNGVGRYYAEGGKKGGNGKDAVIRDLSHGYGGAGYFNNSSTGKCFMNGGDAGECGGFGGGGAIGSLGGGGGGGYSGGGGGFSGGGGGSYIREDGKDIVKKTGHDTHGVVILKQLSYLCGNSPEDTQDISEGDSESILSLTNKSHELDMLLQNGVKKNSEKI
eukprot:TRINITY_DN5095_c0_g3_i6.p1 TRINITY_DN5095_c0_g3~~TRINITY_DN5095_c0_g3_i6.p1  ORF type:complete len:954 (-),score=218.93 TRINITY_DN5095_c0_g3_i6:129-2744(-)